MKKTLKHAACFLPGAGYAAAVVVLAQLLLRGLGVIVGAVSRLAGADEASAAYISQVLGQLWSARINSNGLIAIPLGSVLGALIILWRTHRQTKRRTGLIVLCSLMLIPLALVTVWFSEVNGVRVSALIEILLPLLSGLV